MDQHGMLVAVKDLALQLGRTPTRAEFVNSMTGGEFRLRKLFGTYNVLLEAAGLEVNIDRPKKITNDIFSRSVASHLDAFKPREMSAPSPWPKISSISDIHFPFAHQKVLNRFYERIEEFQPVYIFVNGDAWDMYSHSKFPRSHNQFTPREEHQLARSQNETFWVEVRKRVPTAQCIQMLGNHDVRPLKRVLEAYPEAEDWVTEMLQKALTFDGVKTIFDPREEFLIGDIAIFHGYRSELGAHRDYTLMNCINGHTHVGGATFRQIQGRTLWELNSGLAGDPESKGLTYTPQKLTKWTLGFGEVDSWGPRFIPFR